MKIHENYIKRCIEIAKNGLGLTRPNPMVGCVIVNNGLIIGEGYTSAYGGNHAEVNAIQSVKDLSLLRTATLYVTLEPCAHFGKTPPCSDLIIKSKIPNVVVGCIDVHSKVAGKGIETLKKAGCRVILGVLEDECKAHHKRFFTYHNKKRPYVILKWAQSQDGFLAPETKDSIQPIWLSNRHSRQLVHKWRSEEQAILVGTHTVLMDNPSLTVRDWTGQNPTRIVIDKTLKLSEELSVFNEAAQTIIISESNIDFSKNIAKQICDFLYGKNINSVIIEGGSRTLQTFIEENLWDEARIFIGKIQLKKGIPAPHFSGKLMSVETIINDTLKMYAND